MNIVKHATLNSEVIVGKRRSGSEIATVLISIVKSTYVANTNPPELAATQQDLRLKDEPLDESDPESLFRYEHDLAAFKPRMDIVVVGNPAPPDSGPQGNTWTEQVQLNGASMSINFIDPADSALPLTFGWEPRLGGNRESRTGTIADGQTELPDDFDNLFFNGGLYRVGGAAATSNGVYYTYPNGTEPIFNHAGEGDLVQLTTSATYAIVGGTEIRSEIVNMHLPAVFPTTTWTTRSAGDSDIPMAADTLVYDKSSSEYTVTWRGVVEPFVPDEAVSIVIR